MRRRVFYLTAIALLVVACSAPAPTPTPTPSPYRITRDIAYVPDGNAYQKLDVYLPGSGSGPFPTLVAIHGGNSDKRDLFVLGINMAKKGYAVVSINHRLPPEVYPAPIEDCFCALAWVHAHASEYDLDSKRVAMWGFSAGGTLAAVVGAMEDPAPYLKNCPNALPQSGWLKGAVALSGIYDLTNRDALSEGVQDFWANMLGGPLAEKPDVWAGASPITWVDGNEPPFLVINGEKDTTSPATEAERFAAALRQAGANVQLVIIPGADHASTTSAEAQQALEEFLKGLEW
jgi:acetyl esterase/lipase